MTDFASRLRAALADRYRLEHELGQGGMATVYFAHDLKHDRDVALKVLHAEFGAAVGADRFLAEIRTTARLQHPHILPLLDSGDAGNGLLYYVMPLVTGETLRARLDRERQLPIADAVRIAREVASALDYAHRQNVIHRDIKPENILLHDGQAIVADFGISLALQQAGGPRLTQTGVSLGTPQYMSPEQAMGERTIDARSDIYALGAVTYEMLAGDAPFTGSSVQAIVAKVLSERPTSLRALRDTVPAQVEQAVFTALAKLPADRQASAAEFATALLATSVATPSPDATPGRRSTRDVRLWALVAASLMGGAGIMALVARVGTAASRSANARAEPRFYQIALPDTAPFIAGVDRRDIAMTSLALSRDGHTLAYVAATPGGQRIALVRLDRANSTIVLPGTDGGFLPTFSPDGQSIAFVSGNSLRRIVIADGTVSTLATVSLPSALMWLTDGRIYVSGEAADNYCLSAVPETGGPLTTVARTCEPSFAMSPVDSAARAMMFLNPPDFVGVLDVRADSIIGGKVSGMGSGPIAVEPDRLLLFRDSSLVASRFDFRTARFVGSAERLVTGIRHEAWSAQAQVALSHEGTLVWASGGDAAIADFVWLDRDGAVRDTAWRASAVVSSFVVSPDGNRLAYSSKDASGRPRLLIVDLRRRVTDEFLTGVQVEPHAWIRNGRGLMLIETQPGRKFRSLLADFSSGTMRLDSTASFTDESRDGSLQCSDSGSTVLIERSVPRERPGVFDETTGLTCRFSPDGSMVAYRRASGLYVARTSGKVSDSRVQLTPAGVEEARWSENGRTLYYRYENGWYAVDAPADDRHPSAAPRLVFRGRFLQAYSSGWDLARDGRFLVLQGAPPVRLHTLNVMTNFTTLLDEKLKAAK